MFCKNHTPCDLLFKSSQMLKRKLNFSDIFFSVFFFNCKMEVLKTWFMFFNFYQKKQQNIRFYSSNIACQQY